MGRINWTWLLIGLALGFVVRHYLQSRSSVGG